MWIYEKKLQFPVKIKTPNPAAAKIIISQLGGPDGELAASMRYLNQRFSMPYREVAGILTDIGTEELAHLEMVGSILYQLTRCLGEDDIKKSGFDTYFVDHTAGVYPQAASGVPTDMKYIGVKGDVLADLHEDLSAEQKARVTYDNLLRLIDDYDVCEPLKFLREREIVHYQRFGEAKLLFYTDFLIWNAAFSAQVVRLLLAKGNSQNSISAMYISIIRSVNRYTDIRLKSAIKLKIILQYSKKHGIISIIHNGRVYSYQYTAYEVCCGGGKVRIAEQSIGDSADCTAKSESLYQRTGM